MVNQLVANHSALEAGGMYAHTNMMAGKGLGLYDGATMASEMNSSVGGGGEGVLPTREPFDPRFQKSALDPVARPPRLGGKLLPMIHPPGFKAGGDAMKFWDDRKLTWDQQQDEEDVKDLPGGVWSQEPQFSGVVAAEKSQGINGAARDPIGATPYASRRVVEDVGEEGEEEEGGEGEAGEEVGEGEGGDDEDSFGPVPGVKGRYQGVGSVEGGGGVEEEGGGVFKQVDTEESFYEIPETTRNLGFNGLFSKGHMVEAGGGKKVGGKNKKVVVGVKLNKSLRGFGTESMLNDEEKLKNRTVDDKHYRSWVLPYTDKLLDKSQARFGEYYRFRKQQQLFKDPPPRLMEVLSSSEMNSEHATELYVEGLPGNVARELAVLKLKAKGVKGRLEEKVGREKLERESMGRFSKSVEEGEKVAKVAKVPKVGSGRAEVKKMKADIAAKLNVLLPVEGGGSFVDNEYEKMPHPDRFLRVKVGKGERKEGGRIMDVGGGSSEYARGQGDVLRKFETEMGELGLEGCFVYDGNVFIQQKKTAGKKKMPGMEGGNPYASEINNRVRVVEERQRKKKERAKVERAQKKQREAMMREREKPPVEEVKSGRPIEYDREPVPDFLMRRPGTASDMGGGEDKVEEFVRMPGKVRKQEGKKEIKVLKSAAVLLG